MGCDASVLLDDTSSFIGEKTAGPNANSLRRFDVIDKIKSEIEKLCPNTVSCADILVVAARDSVIALGGPSWTVQLGRRDSTTASFSLANLDLPGSHTIGEIHLTIGDLNLSPLDTITPETFDIAYFKNLQNQKGLFHSDQVLFDEETTKSQVNSYVRNSLSFRADFANSMIKMGNIGLLILLGLEVKLGKIVGVLTKVFCFYYKCNTRL
ncbi:peroxidase family protein [Medicago truncatula]|uniref:peroxidase n=1 Tax=Medicago truncatula TaxID=3880 RepID=G7KX23_MEDTR|nr:peroxidase family protein [Medicago truncatula]